MGLSQGQGSRIKYSKSGPYIAAKAATHLAGRTQLTFLTSVLDTHTPRTTNRPFKASDVCFGSNSTEPAEADVHLCPLGTPSGYLLGRRILCVAGPPRGHACERDHAGHGSETPEQDNHVAARRQQLLRFGVERVVAGACTDREPPSKQRGRGRDADTDAAGAHHVQESPGFPGQSRRRGGHDRAVVGGNEQALADSENRESEHHQ